MLGPQGASINLLHVLLVLAIAAAILVGSVALLPEQFIDYGLMSGFLIWTGYLLVSQWSAPPLRRVLYVVVAIAFVSWITFVLWPFDYPM